MMDFSLPEFPPLRTVYRVYLHKVLPRFAAVITGNQKRLMNIWEARSSPSRAGARWKSYCKRAALRSSARSLCFGVASIYTARKAYE